jgi:hypothetical protein
MVAWFVEIAYGHEDEEQLTEPEPRKSLGDFPLQALNWRNVVAAGAFLLVALWAGNMIVGAISDRSPDVAQNPPVQQQYPPANGSNNQQENTVSDPAAEAQDMSATVRVAALSDCWVKAIVDGETVFSSTMTAGQEQVFEGREAVLLTVGNAGGIEVYYNGEKIGPLGESGEVVKKEFRVARLDP